MLGDGKTTVSSKKPLCSKSLKDKLQETKEQALQNSSEPIPSQCYKTWLFNVMCLLRRSLKKLFSRKKLSMNKPASSQIFWHPCLGVFYVTFSSLAMLVLFTVKFSSQFLSSRCGPLKSTWHFILFSSSSFVYNGYLVKELECFVLECMWS